MNIHEFQAKEVFRKAGIPVPPGEVAETPEKAEEIARKLGGKVVVKAQVRVSFDIPCLTTILSATYSGSSKLI